MASSSQIVCACPHSDLRWKYDVFLSFRGPDTRKGITVELHDRLNRSGIKTFMDEQDLQVGDVISPTLLAAINESRFAIVVLSENYASSTWCLEELREICSSMEDNRILPLFYHVDPTDVRYQKRSFEEAFFKHESSRRHESSKVKQWKAALNKVANISGWNTNDHKTHKELADVIVEYLRSKVVLDAVESIGDFQAFDATSKAIDEVIKALKDDKVTVVGVYGMGGVGKTTMVKHVGALVKKRGIFHCVIVVVVSQTPDMKRIQQTLAELLGFDLHENTELGRAARLLKEIMRREKLLIILDDIWARAELSTIGIPIYTELQKCKSKVLLTTRIWNVCHAMECQEKITLNVLSEKDAWTLFVTKARRSFTSTTFEIVAKKVARECRGLPVALIAVARALGDKELVEWKTAAQALEKSQSANGDHDRVAFECIKLSYDYLKDKDYKSFFLLCCLYPEDYDIPIKDLFKYGIGKGLFRDADTLKEARDRADSVVTHLKHSCLLLDGGEDGCVRMHDVVRDTAIDIAKSDEGGFLVKAGCGLKEWPRHEDYIAVSLMKNDIRKLPEKLVCPKLQILLLNHNEVTRIPETFFQSLNDLRVLDLSYTAISLLPQSISLLTNLLALNLDRCQNTIDISMIGELKKLEILSVRFSYLKEFLKAISGLISLKILDMTGASIDILVSKVIPKLHSLEELYMYGLKERHTRTGFRNKRTEVEREGQETDSFNLVTRLSNLRVLEVRIADAKCIPAYVECSPDWDEFDIDIGTNGQHVEHGYRNMHQYGHKSISFSLDTISGLPNWFSNSVMNKTERLRWNKCQKLIKLFVESESGRLQALKYLTVSGIPDNKRKKTITWVPKTPVFENLEELRLNAVDCVELFAGDLPQGSLRNLKLLDLASCYYWGNAVLLPSGLLQRLPNLEELTCSNMRGIKYLFGYEVLFEPKQPKLRKIVLLNQGTLRSICHGPVPPATFQTLQSLSIYYCHRLQGSLFTYDVAQCLSQLNFLELRECPCLTRIVEASNKMTILPKLKELVLSELPMLHYYPLTFDLECPSLEYLELGDCPKFIVSLSDFHSRKQVQFKIKR